MTYVSQTKPNLTIKPEQKSKNTTINKQTNTTEFDNLAFGFVNFFTGMEEIRCPQCEKPLSNSTCRLVQDACGHKKCRICLLEDEESCYQCKPQENKPSVITKTSQVLSANNVVGILLGGDSTSKKRKKNCDSDGGKKRNYQSIVIPNHISILKDPVSYKCNVCNKVFLTKSHVKYHMYCKGEGMLVCFFIFCS